MKQADVQKVVNPHRVVLYLCALIAAGFGLYVIFYVTPALKTQVLKDIENLYQEGDLIRAVERCETYISDYPGDTMGYVWMGRCYDGIVAKVEQESALREQHLKKAAAPYFSEQQRNEFLRAAEECERQAKRWKAKKDYSREALDAYRKALDVSPDWRTGIEVVKSHIHSGRLDAASEIIARISPSQPADRLYHLLVELELGSKSGKASSERDAFRTQCRRAIELYDSLDPRTMSALLKSNKAVPHLYLAALSRREQQWGEAEALYRRAAQLSPTRYDFHMDWADVLQKQGNHVEAEDVLNELSAQNPSWADVHYEASESQLAQGNLEAALLSLESALYLEIDREDLPLYRRALRDENWKAHRRNPSFQKILGWADEFESPAETLQHLRKAIHCLHAKRFDESACLFAGIANQYPDHYSARMGLLHCSVMQKGHRMAWAKYFEEREAGFADENLSEAEKSRLREKAASETEAVKRRQNLEKFDFEECERSILRLASELKAISPSVFTDLYIAYSYFEASRAAGEGEPAFYPHVVEMLKSLFDRIEDPAAQAIWRDIQAFCHFSLRQFEDALAECERACQLDPSSPAYPFSWGRTLLACDRKTLAAERFRQSAGNAGRLPYWRYRLGMQFLDLGEASPAREQFEICVEEAPRRSMMWYLLGKAHLRGGAPDRALDVLEKAFQSDVNAKRLISYIYRDEDWKSLWRDPRLVRLVRTYAAR